MDSKKCRDPSCGQEKMFEKHRILERGHKKVYAAWKQFYGEITDELEDIHA